mgnify:CR=1 FL=1
MKIDIGPGGKVVGTRKVDEKGRITGLDDYAGEEVLVVLPSGKSEVDIQPEDFLSEVQKTMNEHLTLAFKQYRQLKDSYVAPNDAILNFWKSLTPKSMHSVVDQFNKWTVEQMGLFEKNLEKSLQQAITAWKYER